LHCKVCDREAGKRKFCPLHLKAYENIVEKYALWRKALNIPWEEYLSEIKKNSLTGEWTKEVADYLINNEEIKNGKKS
jgi:predicted metal-binding protein